MRRTAKCAVHSWEQGAEWKGQNWPHVTHTAGNQCGIMESTTNIKPQLTAEGMLNVVTSVCHCLTHKQESSAKLHHKLFFQKWLHSFFHLDTVFNLELIAFTGKHIKYIFASFQNTMQVFPKALNSI